MAALHLSSIKMNLGNLTSFKSIYTHTFFFYFMVDKIYTTLNIIKSLLPLVNNNTNNSKNLTRILIEIPGIIPQIIHIPCLFYSRFWPVGSLSFLKYTNSSNCFLLIKYIFLFALNIIFRGYTCLSISPSFLSIVHLCLLASVCESFNKKRKKRIGNSWPSLNLHLL